MKQKQLYIILLIMILVLAGCKSKSNKNQEPTSPTQTPEAIQTEEPTATPVVENHDGQVKSKLTGLWVDEKIGNRRPYAIMLNNIKYASPQSGTSQADILYEAIVEGGITRLMGIFENFDSKRIGSARSARHYYVSFADEYDAIFVHYGQTKYATAKMQKLGIDNLSGLEGVGNTVFYRDNAIKAPHNAFASYEGIIKGTEQKKYRTEYRDGFEGHYTFYEEDTDLTSDTNVNKVTFKYSQYTHPYFEYDKENKVYKRFQFGGPHIDAITKEQLTFKNIIVQYVKEWNIDKNGYQTMDIENSSGKGYYITNGKAVEITWQKNESTKKMNYYDLGGNRLTINPGKTYISIFPNDRTSDVVFE